MSTIEDLKAKVRRLTDQLRDAEKSLYAAMIAEHPVKVNDLGTYNGKEAIVSSIRVRYGFVRVYVRLKTKSGWHGTEREVNSSFKPYPKGTK